MRDQVHLAEPGTTLVPLSEGSDGDLRLQDRARLGSGPPPDLQAGTLGGEDPIDRGRGDGQELGPHGPVHLELARPLQRCDDLTTNGARRFARYPKYRPSIDLERYLWRFNTDRAYPGDGRRDGPDEVLGKVKMWCCQR